MKRILAVVVVLTVVACSGGPPGDPADPAPERTLSPTAPPWPEGWASAFCYAIDQLGDANGHIVGASEAGSAFDFDGAVVEAEQAATDAKEAAEALEFAGVWPPASSAVVYLSSAAEATQKAANLLKLGAESFDASLIEESTKYIEKATYQVSRARKATEGITSKYGALC